MANYLKHEISAPVPQTEPLDETQVKNHAGGYVYSVGNFGQLRRFLILGSEGGTYYASQKQHTKENLTAIKACLMEDGKRLVDEVVAISDAGRAPKNDPALLTLAYAAAHGNEEVRKYALSKLPQVARTGTHLFHFVSFVTQYRGWGRALKNAVRNWYLDRKTDSLANQVVKYQSRDGWSHRDLLRLTHPVTVDNGKKAAFEFALGREVISIPDEGRPALIRGTLLLQELKDETSQKAIRKAAQLIADYNLPREIVPTQLLKAPEVWESLLKTGGITMIIRNLATMTRVGLLTPLSEAERLIKDKLADKDLIVKGRVHPIQILAANLTYAAGHGMQNRFLSYAQQLKAKTDDKTWVPVQSIVHALDSAFYLAFKAVEPTGKRFFFGIDVSGSMMGGVIAGVPGLTPNIGAAAMALVIANVEENYFIGGFNHTFTPLKLNPRMSLKEAAKVMQSNSFGSTDASQAMQYAQRNGIPADVFCIITDNETYAGRVHPKAALDGYRRAKGKDAKCVVIGMTATNFTIADPSDPGMMDCVGFDTATPQLINEFAKGF